jgi:hypothetical protein
VLGIALRKTKPFLVLTPRSSLQGGSNGSHTSLIELTKEFVDDEVDEVTSRFLHIHYRYEPNLSAPTLSSAGTQTTFDLLFLCSLLLKAHFNHNLKL